MLVSYYAGFYQFAWDHPLKKTQTKDNSQRYFVLLKFGLYFLFWKVVYFYAMTGENNVLNDKFVCFTTPFFFII